jgi:uroporphyrin-III C-methyltransferase
MSGPLDHALASLPRLEPGHVWLAGAGPGSVGCLTLDVVSALGQAEAIVYDALIGDDVLALAGAGAERIFAGKRGGRPSPLQAEITARLIALAREGRRVLRLKGGDPFVFGRGGEEALALAEARIRFRILPGVTSGLAAMAGAGIPATMRGINTTVVFATGHAADPADDPDWAALAKLGQPVVVYMGLKNLRRIADALVAGGLPEETPAAVIASATTAREARVVAPLRYLADAAEAAGLASPALVVVGEIVRLSATLGRQG